MHSTIFQMGRPKKSPTRSIRINMAMVTRLEVILASRNSAKRDKDPLAKSLTLPDLLEEYIGPIITREYPKAVEQLGKTKQAL